MAAKKVQQSTRAPAAQKLRQQTFKSKKKRKPDGKVSTKDKKALVVTQEIKLARLLASNDKRVRDKILKYLRKWLTVRAKSSFAFTETDFMRLWKGLFYCMWMSDKPLIQEELAESLSKLVQCFDTKEVVLLYTVCALKTLGIEWFGIDQYRLDKFAMLARRIIRQTFQTCKEKSWDMEWMEGLSKVLLELLSSPKTCLGFSMHIIEVFFEELAKISGGDIPKEVITELVKPFTERLAMLDDERQIRHIMKHIFRYLIFQSDVGIEYTEKFNAWRQAGFPAGHIDAMQKVELSDEDEANGFSENGDTVEEGRSNSADRTNTEKPLDPRAGRVDVELPQIPFDAKQIIELLTQYKHHPSSTTKSRRQILHLIKEFSELSEGKMPLGIKEVTVPDKRKGKNNTKAAALRLLEFEKELYSDNPPHKRKRKQGKLLLDEELEDEQESSDEFPSDIDENDVSDADDGQDAMDVADEGSSKKQEKGPKNDNIDRAEETDFQKMNGTSNTSNKKTKKKKKRKKDDSKIDSDANADEQNDDSESVLVNLSNTHKKTKSKQKALAATSTSDLVTPVKKRKLARGKVCGSWDVSENVDPPTPTSIVSDDTISSDTSIAADSTPVKSTPPVPLISVTPDNEPMWLLPVLKKLDEKKTPPTNNVKQQTKPASSSGSKKRVKIVLQRNTAQHTSEYIQKIRQSPGIPFDAEKKPLVGVLKASPIPSPINPFYKRNFK